MSGDGVNHTPETPHPRIYAASLSDYNAGRLHGEWIDAAQEVDDLELAVQAMLRRSHEPVAEEWAIHDYDGFAPLSIEEFTPLRFISQIACGIAEHGPAFADWADLLDRVSWDDDLGKFDEAFQGEWQTRSDYAEELLDGIGVDMDEIGPDLLRPYVSVDLDAFSRGLAGEVDFVRSPDGGYFVFEHD